MYTAYYDGVSREDGRLPSSLHDDESRAARPAPSLSAEAIDTNRTALPPRQMFSALDHYASCCVMAGERDPQQWAELGPRAVKLWRAAYDLRARRGGGVCGGCAARRRGRGVVVRLSTSERPSADARASGGVVAPRSRGAETATILAHARAVARPRRPRARAIYARSSRRGRTRVVIANHTPGLEHPSPRHAHTHDERVRGCCCGPSARGLNRIFAGA